MSKVLIAVDFSDVTGRVVNEGVKLAKALGSEVVLIHTEPPESGYVFYDAAYSALGGMGYYTDYNPDLEKAHQEIIRNNEHALQVLKDVVEKKGVEVSTILIEGEVTSALIDETSSEEYEMLVVGSHQHGKLYNLLFKDLSSSLLNKVKCPLLIVPKRKQ